MSIVVYHHPFSRAANVVWMLEELGLDYEIEHVDIMSGAQKSAEFLKLNPMGKLPTIVDGEVVATESAAIAMYLADRYSLGELAPATDSPERATYLRWILFGPSVIEPGAYAHASKWEFKPGSAGWGTWEAMHDAIESAIGDGPWILGDHFTMADVCFGGTLLFMLQFGMIEKRDRIVAYAERLRERDAWKRQNDINQGIVADLGLGG